MDVIRLPEKIDSRIAALELNVSGIAFDSLTDEQKKYSLEWREGT